MVMYAEPWYHTEAMRLTYKINGIAAANVLEENQNV